MSGCYYVGTFAQVFGVTQIIPTLVTWMLTILSLFTSQIIFTIYGFYLHLAQWFVWVFQSYFARLRPNPICQLYQSYAFPNLTGYYTASLITFVLLYGYFWDVAHSWIIWVVFYVVGFGVPLTMIWFEWVSLTEVLISMGIGVLVTLVFVIILKFYICPALPFLLNEFPCTWLGYKDEFLMCPQEKAQFYKCQAALEESTNAARGLPKRG